MILYALTIVVSAFLLFQVQPVIAKIILPWFGGSAAVWTTCLLFFQMVLLLGYLYAHATVRYLKPRVQMLVHAALLLASAAVLPIYPHTAWKPAGTEDPSLRILGLLAATVGLPYLLLSTTGPLLQAWYARRSRPAGRERPWRPDAWRKGTLPGRVRPCTGRGWAWPRAPRCCFWRSPITCRRTWRRFHS